MNRAEARLIELEAQMRVLHSRVMRLEAGGAPAAQPAQDRARAARAPLPPRSPEAPAPRETAARPPLPAERRAPVPEPAPERRALPRPPRRGELEDLLGGRVLAWVGGAAVVLGLAFFFALAISRGWIGEEARTTIAAIGSLLVLACGAWLRERRGRTEAAMAAAAAGLAGLFVTVVVAARVYELIPALPALAFGIAIGALGVALALRWNAQVIGGIGILGAVLSPVLAGADYDATTVALLFLATAAGSAVLVYKNWTWLAAALFVLATPQWVPWAATGDSAVATLLALCGFGAAGLTAAVGFAVRSRADRLSHTSAFLMSAGAVVLALVGWVGFHDAAAPVAADAWLAGLAIVHVGVGVSIRAEKRISPDLSVLALGIGIVLADVAWGAIIDGPAVAVGWAASAVGFAFTIARGQMRSIERQAVAVGLGGQVVIALGHVLTHDVPVSAISGTASVDGLVALASLAAACLVSGRLAEDGYPQVCTAVDTAGLAAVAYLTAAALDGPALVAALAGEAFVLAVVARSRRDEVAKAGAFAFLALGGAHALAVEAPPASFLYGAHSTVALAAALGAVTLAMARIAVALDLAPGTRRALVAGAATTALYGVSVAIVTAFQPGADAAASQLLEIGVRQQGQMLVSALWSLSGAAAVVAGLTRGSRDLRLAGLALLVAAIAKVFLFDLATLTSVYRVISFVALGVVLLLGSYAWQRLRPAPLPDLREV